jgi:hypothetical protein
LRRRQAKFIGHVLGKGKLEDIVTTGKICGKLDRGRQREKVLRIRMAESVKSGSS